MNINNTTNKKHKNIVLTIGLVLSGALATSATISASEFTQEESCYKYIGYIRENVLVEATTETASSESDEEVTVDYYRINYYRNNYYRNNYYSTNY